MGTDATDLAPIMTLYNDGNYTEASQKLDELATDEPLVVIYKAICYSETNKMSQAIELLEANRFKNTEYALTIDWHLILFYLANANETKAEQLLDKFIVNTDGYQKESALKLKADLSSFWR